MTFLQIDVSNSGSGDDLIQIRFKNEDFLQVNFSKLVSQSKYIREKYKYSEALDLIQSEIEAIENKFNIKEETFKLFIQLIQDEKISIPIELYKDFYTLSEYFCIPKFTTALDNIIREQLFNNLILNFDSEATKNRHDTELTIRIEEFLRERINECISNSKFRELQLSTIYRIIDKSKENIDHDSLLNFILESPNARFILLKFIKLDKLNDQKVNEFIKFISKQEETTKNKYLEYMPFNLSFIQSIKNKYDKLFNEMKQMETRQNQTKKELEQAKKKMNQTKEELEQTKKKMNQTKEENNKIKMENEQTKKELNQCKIELNQFRKEEEEREQAILITGRNNVNQLGQQHNNTNKSNERIIFPPAQMSIKQSSLLSYSVYYEHLVVVTKDCSLKAIGNNSSWWITTSLPNTEIKQLTEFSIKDRSGGHLTPFSAVCSYCGTLYMLSKNNGKEKQLVFSNSLLPRDKQVFLDIGNHQPVSLFGGDYNAAAICAEGEVIFINYSSVANSPESRIEAVSLPNGEKASSVACCNDYFIVLSTNGCVFESKIEYDRISGLSAVNELIGKEIVCVSGTRYHFLAVSKEGRVFGRGRNSEGQLGFVKERSSISSFTEISSLSGYKIRAASAGWDHSLFETIDGKILSCGSNRYGQLLLNSGPDDNFHLPAETTITRDSTFCIAGEHLSIIFIKCKPPPKTPNIRIQQYK